MEVIMVKKIWLGLIILAVVLVFSGCDDLFEDVPSWAQGKWYIAAVTGEASADNLSRKNPVFEITNKQYILLNTVGVNVESISGDVITFIGGQKIKKHDGSLCTICETKASLLCAVTHPTASSKPCNVCKSGVGCVQIDSFDAISNGYKPYHK